MDLGNSQSVVAISFLVKNGYADIEIFTGVPGDWQRVDKVSIEGYYSWNRININSETQFLMFDLQPTSSIEIVELAVLGAENQKITIEAIVGEGIEHHQLLRLIDEQEKVEIPSTYMSETFFDEIYFVRTAENYLKLEDPYEWTHPPLGKLLISCSILISGNGPYGWRIMGVIFATIMIPVMYLLGKALLGTWIGAFASAFLLSFDFMHFTMARMATVDTYVVFFSLTSHLFFLFYFKNVLKCGWKTSVLPMFLAVLFFSLGFSTKWLVVFGFLGQLFLLLIIRFRDIIPLKESLRVKLRSLFADPFLLIFGFLVVAVLIYLAIYIPYMLTGHTFTDVIRRQLAMSNYHSALTATHPFSSEWWSWPLMLRPVWLYVSNLSGGVASTITLMGNPAVWWVGFACVILALERLIRKKDLACLFIVTLFFFQWLPYLIISRATFIYHFYVNVPFLCLATAYFLNKLWSRKWGKVLGIAYLAIVVILFAMFYPVISGSPTPNSWIENLKWLGSWVF